MSDSELKPCPFCGETAHLSTRAEGSLTSDMPARPYRICCHHVDHDDVEGPIGYGRAGAVAAWNRRAPTALATVPGESGVKDRVRHKKRGSEYEVLGYGAMQAENWIDDAIPFEVATEIIGGNHVDMREVAIYRSVDDGSLWVRPREEFEDGRFEPVAALQPQPSAPASGEVAELIEVARETNRRPSPRRLVRRQRQRRDGTPVVAAQRRE